MPLVTPQIASAQETRNAFVWIEFAVPSDSPWSSYTLNSVLDVSNNGHIVGIVSGSGSRGFVILNGTWYMLKPDVSSTVRDVNNLGDVVGWKGTDDGMVWEQGTGDPYDGAGTVLSTTFKSEGVNDDQDFVGYETDDDEPQAYLGSAYWYPLPPLPSGSATAAHGIGNSVNHDPIIVGTSYDATSSEPLPVAWLWNGSGFDVQALDPTNAVVSDTPYIINDNDWIVGSTDGTTSAYDYLLWVPHGNGGWDRVPLGRSGSSAKAVGINGENEVVAGRYLFVDDGYGLDEYDLFDLAAIPVQGEASRYYTTSTTSFHAINDNGWIVGKATRKESGENDVPVVLLLVPYDMDNSGTPDYREIIANPTLDDDENWVLDKSEQMRVGLYAAGFNPEGTRADEVDDIQAVRLHLDDEFIHDIVTDSQICANTQNALEAWRQSEDQKEIIAMIRTKYATDKHYDAIMTGETKENYLDDLFCFAYRYAYDIDFIQFGNEIYEGPGEYWINGEGLGGIDGDDLPAACDAVFAWIGEQMAVARMASALAGRPLRFIGPAVTRRAIISGYGGNLLSESLDMDDPEEDNPFRDAYNIKRLVEFANANHAYVDAHLHYNLDGQLEAALDYLVNPSENTWDTPIWRTCMEWSPVTTGNWAIVNNPTYRKYFWEYEGAPAELWNDYVDAWGTDTENGGLGRSGFPGLGGDLTDMESYGLLHACYGEFNQGTIPTQQTAPNYPLPDQFDLTVLRAESVFADDDWILDSESLWTAIRGDMETDNGTYRITPFTPHPNAPTTSCSCVTRP